jgi:hypothetical protein
VPPRFTSAAPRSRTRATPPEHSSRSPATSPRPCSASASSAQRWLAAAIVPLSTAYSEAFAAPADVNDTPKEAPLLYASFVLMAVVAAALVLIPGAPLVPILFHLSSLNAVLLLVLLPLMRRLARDPAVMGRV